MSNAGKTMKERISAQLAGKAGLLQKAKERKELEARQRREREALIKSQKA